MSAETIQWLQDNTLIGFTKARGHAWHWREGSDNHYEGAIPVEDARKLLSYPLVEADVSASYIDEEGVTSVQAEDRKAIVRKDTGNVLGIFKSGYQLHQPEEWCLENVDMLLHGDLQIGSVVVLKGGAVASLQVEMPETRVAREGIEHRPFLTAATSHDGTLATTYLTGTQLVVCDNTLSAALREQDAKKIKIRHSAHSLSRVMEVRDSLDIIVEQVGDAFDQQVSDLIDNTVSDSRWNEFVDAYTGVQKAPEGRAKTIAEKKVSILDTLWNSDNRVAPWKNTAYGVLAAINTAAHHEFGAEKTRGERNFMKTLNGDWEKQGQNVLKLLDRV